MKIDGLEVDTMKEACARLKISRATMLRYLADGFFSKPRLHKQGRDKKVRVFDEGWYGSNERKLKESQGD